MKIIQLTRESIVLRSQAKLVVLRSQAKSLTVINFSMYVFLHPKLAEALGALSIDMVDKQRACLHKL